MQTLSRLVLAAAAAAALACSGPSEPPHPLEGDFVALDPWPTGPGFVLGLTLAVNGTTVTGTGWLGGLGFPPELLTVSGEFTDPDFDLAVTTEGGYEGALVGAVTPSGVQATYHWAPGVTPTPVTLVRINPGATGRHAATVTGDVTGQILGSAGFGVFSIGFALHIGHPSGSSGYPLVALEQTGGSRPGPGSYALGPASVWRGAVYAPSTQTPRQFTITGGTLRIFVSTPYVLLGRVEVQAQESGTGATVSLTSDFNAACGAEICK